MVSRACGSHTAPRLAQMAASSVPHRTPGLRPPVLSVEEYVPLPAVPPPTAAALHGLSCAVSVSSLTHGPPAACLSDFRMLTGGCRHPLGFQGPCHSPSLTSGVGHFSSDVCWPLTGHQVGPILKTCHVSCLVSAPVSGRPLESSMGPMTMALPGLPPLSLRPVLFLTWAQQSAQLPQSLAFVLSTNPGS